MWQIKRENREVIELDFKNWREATAYVRQYTVPVTIQSPDGKVRTYRPTYSGGLKRRFVGCLPVKDSHP